MRDDSRPFKKEKALLFLLKNHQLIKNIHKNKIDDICYSFIKPFGDKFKYNDPVTAGSMIIILEDDGYLRSEGLIFNITEKGFDYIKQNNMTNEELKSKVEFFTEGSKLISKEIRGKNEHLTRIEINDGEPISVFFDKIQDTLTYLTKLHKSVTIFCNVETYRILKEKQKNIPGLNLMVDDSINEYSVEIFYPKIENEL
ncbi:hypothetical protein [Paenimyroides ceti]